MRSNTQKNEVVVGSCGSLPSQNSQLSKTGEAYLQQVKPENLDNFASCTLVSEKSQCKRLFKRPNLNLLQYYEMVSVVRSLLIKTRKQPWKEHI